MLMQTDMWSVCVILAVNFNFTIEIKLNANDYMFYSHNDLFELEIHMKKKNEK